MSDTTTPRAQATASSARGRQPAGKQALAYLGCVVALAVAGFLVDDPYVRHVLILCFLWSLVVAGWDLVLGYAGIFNYAQLVFFAVGAYATGMLTTQAGVPSAVALVLSPVIVGAFGLLVALPCLRLRGEYVALFTFAVHLALPPLILKAKPWGTGGALGIFGIPPIEVAGISFGPRDVLAWYLLTLVVAAAAIYVVYFVILRRRMGRAFVALRDSEDFARSLGVSDFRYKLLAFMISAALTGLAGALYAHYTSVVTPKILGNEFFLLAMVMLAIGGLGRFPGVVVGAFIVTIANELLRSAGNTRLLLLGLAVVLTLLLLPKGIVSLRGRAARLLPTRKPD